MTVKTILVATRELLSDPARWTRGVLARNATGGGVWPRDPDAVCWCLHGAVLRCGAKIEPTDVDCTVVTANLVWNTAKARHGLHSIEINDRLGHAAVLELLDTCIRDLE